jgi:hypothetical protein
MDIARGASHPKRFAIKVEVTGVKPLGLGGAPFTRPHRDVPDTLNTL